MTNLHTPTLSHIREQLLVDLQNQEHRRVLHLAEYRHNWSEDVKNKWRVRQAEIYGQVKEIDSMLMYITRLIRVNQ
jgi:hypothetical protein